MIEPNPETRKKFISEYQDKQKDGTITPTESDALASLLAEEEQYQKENPEKEKDPPKTAREEREEKEAGFDTSHEVKEPEPTAPEHEAKQQHPHVEEESKKELSEDVAPATTPVTPGFHSKSEEKRQETLRKA